MMEEDVKASDALLSCVNVHPTPFARFVNFKAGKRPAWNFKHVMLAVGILEEAFRADVRAVGRNYKKGA
jgi:hypothetical protein